MWFSPNESGINQLYFIQSCSIVDNVDQRHKNLPTPTKKKNDKNTRKPLIFFKQNANNSLDSNSANNHAPGG
jgi:hypothetical protein